MPKPPRTQWKRRIFNAISRAEHGLRSRNSPGAEDWREIRNFLFLQYEAALGSVVHATPVFEALKQAIPDAHIAVAASAMAASVLGNSPYVDRCIVTPNPFRQFARATTAVRTLVRSMPPGRCCIATTVGNQRTRIALLSLLGGAAVRAGYTLAPELYDLPLHFHPERGQIEANLDILRRLGHDVSFREPSLFFSEADRDHAAKLLQSAPEAAARIAFVTQNSGGQRNQWSQERFAQVIVELTRRSAVVPIFVGTACDGPAIDSLRQGLLAPGISMAGKTTVAQLAAVLAQCDLTVSLDTGTFHVARAVGLPGVVIAPAWQSALEWLPVGHERYRVLQGPRIAEPHPGYAIDEISVEQVTAAALELLQQFPPSVAQRAVRMQNFLSSSSALRQ